MDQDLIKLLGAGGVTAVMLGLFVWLVRKVGDRMVLSIDKLNERTEATTRTISEVGVAIGRELSQMRQDVAILSARLDVLSAVTKAIDEITPPSIELPVRPSTPPPVQPPKCSRTAPSGVGVVVVRPDQRRLLMDRVDDESDDEDDRPHTGYSIHNPRRPY